MARLAEGLEIRPVKAAGRVNLNGNDVVNLSCTGSTRTAGMGLDEGRTD
jgi:hypothetical protein